MKRTSKKTQNGLSDDLNWLEILSTSLWSTGIWLMVPTQHLTLPVKFFEGWQLWAMDAAGKNWKQ